MDQLSEREVRVPIKPVGIKYRCEFCNEGFMESLDDQPRVIEVLATDPPQYKKPLIVHKCTKCGRLMQLPRTYPSIEWIEESENIET